MLCTLFFDYFPPEELLGMPLGNALRIRRPKVPQLKKVANCLPFTKHTASAFLGGMQGRRARGRPAICGRSLLVCVVAVYGYLW